MDGHFTLSVAAVDVLSQVLGVDGGPFPLRVPHLGDLDEDRARIAATVLRDLARRGLVGDGGVHPDLVRAMRLLASGEVSVAVMGTAGVDPIQARASASGADAVLAVQEGQFVRWELITAESMVRRVVGLLTDVKAGPGHSVTITRPAAAEDSVFQQSAVDDPGLRRAEAMLRRPRTGCGYFVVEPRRRGASPGTLSWFDTDAGRYLTLVRPGGGTFSPADRPRLHHTLQELLATSG